MKLDYHKLNMSTYIILKKHIENVRKKRKLSPRVHRIPETTAFSLEDDEFNRLFLLSKKCVIRLCKILHKELAPKCGTQTAIPVEIKVLCALRYFASGSLQKDIGKDATLNISQSAVSRCVVSVSEAICNKILPNSIKFPKPSQYQKVKETFNDITGFPGTIGAIGCTHIRIVAPSENGRFLDSEGHHSLNVLLVCDAKMKIMHVDASYPGASVDWFVWKFSKIRATLQADWSKGNCDSWLIASDRYQPEPWLLTPFKEPASVVQRTYNVYHARTLGMIDRCICLLKKRFDCLRWALRVSPAIAELIVKACVVLHNMCLDESVDGGFLDEDESGCSAVESDVLVPVDESVNNAAMEQRQKVAQVYFS